MDELEKGELMKLCMQKEKALDYYFLVRSAGSAWEKQFGIGILCEI